MKIPPFQIENFIQKISSEKIAGCLLFGPESALVNYRFNIVAKKLAPDLTDPFLVTNFSKEKLSEDKAILSDEFFSYSMLGGRKLIMIRDSDVAAAGALKILFADQEYANKSDNFILIQGGDLDKSSSLRKICEDNPCFASIACYEDDDRVIKQFIADQLRKGAVKFNVDVTNTIFEKFGKNRQIILSELDKIFTYLGDEKDLSVELIEKLTASEADISTDKFINNFVTQKFDLALINCEKLFREGFEPIMLARFLSNYLQKLYRARMEIDYAGSSFDEAVKNQRLFFKIEGTFRMALKGLSREFLLKNLSDLQNLEIKMKSGSMPPKLLFTSFVQSFITQKISKS